MVNCKIKNWIAALLHLVIVTNVVGQENADVKYPQNYFRNPLDIPISLAANFGEIRPNHWHMGLDIRTNQRENLAVHAAADGYIAHIGVRPSSFGQFIVINHPNGYSTLYAHLNKFFPELEKYIRQKQKEQESWAIELDFNEQQFPVKKGDFIARSGNTGGSQGPHLHFEIRDTKSGRCLNPLLFGFDIKDTQRPVITRLAMYDRTTSTYYQTPKAIALKRIGLDYTTNPGKILTGSNRISFAIGAYDKQNNSYSPEGIFSAMIYLDGTPQTEFVLNNIDYDETRYINAQVDYRYDYNGGPSIQHLSRMPGDKGRVYHEISGVGVIELKDAEEHKILIEVKDAYGNLSKLSFLVQYSTNISSSPIAAKKEQLIPGYVFVKEESDFEVVVPENCIYDTAAVVYSRLNNSLTGAISPQFRFNDPSIPVHSDIKIRIRPSVNVPVDQKDRVVLLREWKGRRNAVKARWENSWLTASFRDFGNFQAFVDQSPPQINAPARGSDTLNLSALSRIIFTPSDNFGVSSFHAELDDQWLMFTNDKGRSHIYIFDEQCPYGTHKLKVTVTDIAGNVTEKTWWFKRYRYTPPKKKVVPKKRTTKKN